MRESGGGAKERRQGEGCDGRHFLGGFREGFLIHLQRSPGIWRSYYHRVTDEEAEAQRGSVTTQSHTANVSKAEI